MKYQKEISKSFIKVWEDFYINYLTMFNILEPQYKKYKENKKKMLEKEIQSHNFSQNIDSAPLLSKELKDNELNTASSNSVKQKFQEQFMLELKKVDFFYNQNITKVIRPKIKEIKSQIKHANMINEFKMNADTFEMAIKETYKDIRLTRNFMETNMEIKNKLMNKYKKYFGIAITHYSRKKFENNSQIILEDEKENEEYEDEIENVINEYISYQSSIGAYDETLKNLEEEIETCFIKIFRINIAQKLTKF